MISIASKKTTRNHEFEEVKAKAVEIATRKAEMRHLGKSHHPESMPKTRAISRIERGNIPAHTQCSVPISRSEWRREGKSMQPINLYFTAESTERMSPDE